ncbi:hypothetical protein GCM10011326_45370 [Salipiger profundus]|nr:hypothetical protein GCM10011326_45370 [Salipiger profundus]
MASTPGWSSTTAARSSTPGAAKAWSACNARQAISEGVRSENASVQCREAGAPVILSGKLGVMQRLPRGATPWFPASRVVSNLRPARRTGLSKMGVPDPRDSARRLSRMAPAAASCALTVSQSPAVLAANGIIACGTDLRELDYTAR